MMTYLRIEMTDEELGELQQIARDQGFESPEAYVKSLAFAPTKAELLNDIRSGILAAQRGDPLPTMDDLWVELAAQAEARGYASLSAYLRALVAADELVLALRDDWRNTDDGVDVIEVAFRESWHEAMTGQTLRVDQLWDSLDNDAGEIQAIIADLPEDDTE